MSLSVLERQIVELKKERSNFIKRGDFKKADLIYNKIYELELNLKSKKILSVDS